jgi:hypothetical protein
LVVYPSGEAAVAFSPTPRSPAFPIHVGSIMLSCDSIARHHIVQPTRFDIRQSPRDLTAMSGLAFVGIALNRFGML